MIPQYSIQEWHEQVPWNTDAMVEQDLIICIKDLQLASVTLKKYWNVTVSTWSLSLIALPHTKSLCRI